MGLTFRNIILGIFFAAKFNVNMAAASLSTLPLDMPSNMTEAKLHYAAESELPATNGVLLLCPGMNGNGFAFAAEAPWRAFAKSHGLGLVGLSFSSAPSSLYGHPAKGYYYPEQGSGAALIKGLKLIYKRDVGILLYGFSGGAQFGSRFADQNPQRMLGWAAYSASFWSAPLRASSTSAPGLIACGEFDAERYGPSFAFFQQGRRRDARWTWVSLPKTAHARHLRFEEFVRAYFAAVLAAESKEALWFDAEMKKPMTEEDQFLNSALSVWLPTPAIANSWLTLHHP